MALPPRFVAAFPPLRCHARQNCRSPGSGKELLSWLPSRHALAVSGHTLGRDVAGEMVEQFLATAKPDDVKYDDKGSPPVEPALGESNRDWNSTGRPAGLKATVESPDDSRARSRQMNSAPTAGGHRYAPADYGHPRTVAQPHRAISANEAPGSDIVLVQFSRSKSVHVGARNPFGGPKPWRNRLEMRFPGRHHFSALSRNSGREAIGGTSGECTLWVHSGVAELTTSSRESCNGPDTGSTGTRSTRRTRRLELWVRRKRGNRKLECSGCGRKFSDAYDMQRAGGAGPSLESSSDHRAHRGVSGEMSGLRSKGREGAAAAEQGAVQQALRGRGGAGVRERGGAPGGAAVRAGREHGTRDRPAVPGAVGGNEARSRRCGRWEWTKSTWGRSRSS